MPDAIEFYGRLLEAGELAFDIGANVGIHTDAMLRAGARVVAVEPQANLARELGRRLRCEALTVRSCAVGDTSGVVVLATASKAPHLATANVGWRLEAKEPEGTWDGEQVRPMVTLADLIARYGVPDLLKIDTEGYDHLVLATLLVAVRRVMFEVHSGLPLIAEACFDHLEALGTYEYRLTREEAWAFDPDRTLSRGEILENLPTWGDVLAERAP